MIEDVPSWSIRSVLVSVSDLDRSANFYRDVMNLHEVLREDQMVVLGDATGPFTLFLREARHGAVLHSGQQALGARSVIYDVGSIAELDRVEAHLRALGAFLDRRSLDDTEAIQFLRGHDPDRLPMLFVAHEPGRVPSVEDFRRALATMYVLDL
jgi:catechol 2,3-dioxygenase-like lactoylglutathione lyase family enzyme